jgi:hypothetical protein
VQSNPETTLFTVIDVFAVVVVSAPMADSVYVVVSVGLTVTLVAPAPTGMLVIVPVTPPTALSVTESVFALTDQFSVVLEPSLIELEVEVKLLMTGGRIEVLLFPPPQPDTSTDMAASSATIANSKRPFDRRPDQSSLAFDFMILISFPGLVSN